MSLDNRELVVIQDLEDLLDSRDNQDLLDREDSRVSMVMVLVKLTVQKSLTNDIFSVVLMVFFVCYIICVFQHLLPLAKLTNFYAAGCKSPVTQEYISKVTMPLLCYHKISK